MWLDHFLIAFAWITYCALHSILASAGVKSYFRQRIKSANKYYRPAYVIFSFLGLLALLWFLFVLKSPRIFEINLTVQIIGYLAALGGFILMAVCIWRYFLSLSGLKSLMNESVTNELIISGINKYLRHPLYLGTFIFIWGLWLLYPTVSFLITDTIITTYTLLGIKLEEKKLIAEFGDQYVHYQNKVPMLLPRLHRKPIQIE